MIHPNDELSADMVKRYRGGPCIECSLQLPGAGFSVLVLFGPSGSGKTTLLRCLAGLERVDEGLIRLGGEVWDDPRGTVHLPPQRRGVGYLAQEYALFPHLSVADNITYGLQEFPRHQRRERCAELLALLGLEGLQDRLPAQLSGGEQQRVALARTLAPRPRLLLLDEPLSALDAPTREQLRLELRRWLQAAGAPVVLVTHDRTEAMILGDRVIVLKAGKALQHGPVAEVFARPASLAVAQMVGVETLLQGMVIEVVDGVARVRVGATSLVAASGPLAGLEPTQARSASKEEEPLAGASGLPREARSASKEEEPLAGASGLPREARSASKEEEPLAGASGLPREEASKRAAGGYAVGVCIRAEEVRLETDRAPASGDNLLPAVVRMLYHEGPVVRVELDCGVPLVALITAPMAREMHLQQGDSITARIAPAAVHLVPASESARLLPGER